jgi:hypothetical protein
MTRRRTSRSRPHAARRAATTAGTWLAATLAAAALTGCYKPLFPENAERTPFERYQRVRGEYIPLEEPDVFGNPHPALRARLSQSY